MPERALASQGDLRLASQGFGLYVPPPLYFQGCRVPSCHLTSIMGSGVWLPPSSWPLRGRGPILGVSVFPQQTQTRCFGLSRHYVSVLTGVLRSGLNWLNTPKARFHRNARLHFIRFDELTFLGQNQRQGLGFLCVQSSLFGLTTCKVCTGLPLQAWEPGPLWIKALSRPHRSPCGEAGGWESSDLRFCSWLCSTTRVTLTKSPFPPPLFFFLPQVRFCVLKVGIRIVISSHLKGIRSSKEKGSPAPSLVLLASKLRQRHN